MLKEWPFSSSNGVDGGPTAINELKSIMVVFWMAALGMPCLCRYRTYSLFHSKTRGREEKKWYMDVKNNNRLFTMAVHNNFWTGAVNKLALLRDVV